MFRSIRWHVRTQASFTRVSADGNVDTTTAWFLSRADVYSHAVDFDPQRLVAYLNERVVAFNERGSNWIFQAVEEFEICYTAYRPMIGGSFVETPDYIARKNAIVNIKNKDDDFCFLYSVLAGIKLDRHNMNHVYQYKQRLAKKEIEVGNLQFPLDHSDVRKFEDLNPDISVSVFMWVARKEGLCPLYPSPHRNRKHHVKLLLLDNDGKQHYTLIKNMSRLIFDRNNYHGKSFLCDWCLHPFSSQRVLDEHLANCIIHKPQSIKFPP
ncbi:MAG TPA: hypothetical protein VLS45_05895 [Methylomicrobium sp.]|nr:hypothetical protein [Methylomicrobium sp.]